jgi:DNA-binding beta-propeller fold protein YncE
MMQLFEKFRSIRSGMLAACTAGALIGFLFAVPAQAAVHFVNLGTAAPPSSLGGIAVTPFDQAPQAAISDLTTVTTIPGCPVPGTLSLSPALEKDTVPSGAWSHGYTGAGYLKLGVTTVTLTLPPSTSAFYFYAEGDDYVTLNITATTDSGVSSGPVAVTTPGGATGFGFYADGGSISTITISVHLGSLGFIVGEFGIAGSPGWAVVSNNDDADILTFDLSTDPPTEHGPFFLRGQLGAYGLLNVAAAPGGHYALVSNWAEERLFRIDLSDPAAPSFDGSVLLPLPPADIAFSPDGSYALVTNGRRANNQIAVIDLAGFSLKTTYTLRTGAATMQAVAIAPDNTTWVATDSVNNQILYGTYSLASGFSGEQSLPAGSHPTNVSISPDGQTVLVADGGSAEVSVYRITGPGILVAEQPVTGLPSGCQSIVFSPDGTRAYVLSGSRPCKLSWLSVTGPGAVLLGGAGVASLPFDADGPSAGIDQMAISGDGQTLLFTNPFEFLTTNIAFVNTSTFAVTTVDTGSSYPIDVATFQENTCPPIAVTSAPSPIPSGVVGTGFPANRFEASGGTGPYSFSLAADSSPLPPGLTLSSDGTISGTPTAAGTYTFTIVATDSDGCRGRLTTSLTVFSVSYHDDSGRSVLCVDTTTGAYRWAVLSGVHAGQVYTGTLHVYNRGTLFWSQGGPGPTIIINYFPSSHVAWGFFYDSSTPVYSRLYDSNTLDDPSGCGALPPV